jgi:hypothetical protein
MSTENKNFWISNATAGYGARVYLREDAPWCDHSLIKEMSIWRGSDKSYGPWKGYEMSSKKFSQAITILKSFGYQEIQYTD